MSPQVTQPSGKSPLYSNWLSFSLLAHHGGREVRQAARSRPKRPGWPGARGVQYPVATAGPGTEAGGGGRSPRASPGEAPRSRARPDSGSVPGGACAQPRRGGVGPHLGSRRAGAAAVPQLLRRMLFRVAGARSKEQRWPGGAKRSVSGARAPSGKRSEQLWPHCLPGAGRPVRRLPAEPWTSLPDLHLPHAACPRPSRLGGTELWHLGLLAPSVAIPALSC